MVLCVTATSERNATVLSAYAFVHAFYFFVQIIKPHILDKSSVIAWHWLKGNHSGSCNRTSENRVRASIRANVNKKVFVSQNMKQKAHVRELIEAGINVAG